MRHHVSLQYEDELPFTACRARNIHIHYVKSVFIASLTLNRLAV